MLKNNYKQAVDIITSKTPLLDSLLAAMKVGKEPTEDVHRVAYVELLQELRSARDVADGKTSNFLNAIPEDYNINGGATTYTTELSSTRRLETQRKAAREKVERVTQEVVAMEAKLNITSRWDSSMPEYLNALQYMAERRYRKALDNLERLVVQRLFELHRLNVSGIGYRARSLLAKAMRTRSKAIRNAVERYNAAAKELSPPKEVLDWKRIAEFNFVEEFSVLREARQDIRKERWSDGEVRETMKLHQRIKRAHEERDRLNIEVKEDLIASGEWHLYGAILDFCTRRERVNCSLVKTLREITAIDGYTGKKDLLGVRIGSKGKGRGQDASVNGEGGSGNDSDGDHEGDEEEEAQMGGIVDFISELSTS
ncbi:hypothetical protein EST38_g13690 [Candolleomyces aberdarensis]|uniref:Uncharacterized protein n=1 Tax=Candolleomyces aberdarensis TaxID=2316362 RepID=A0A4Q2D1Z9_9AGAR|nr:hypothetical protein EST38_g13690 [Candolleomyces aberdarensis]